MPAYSETPPNITKDAILYELFGSADGPTTGELIARFGRQEPAFMHKVTLAANELRRGAQSEQIAADAFISGAVRGLAFLILAEERPAIISQLEAQFSQTTAEPTDDTPSA